MAGTDLPVKKKLMSKKRKHEVSKDGDLAKDIIKKRSQNKARKQDEDDCILSDKKKKKPTKVSLKSPDDSGAEKAVTADRKGVTKEEKQEKMRQKKMKKKELAQQQREAGPSQTQDESITAALEYLRNWHSNRDEWRFQKRRQTWLLQHMYNTAQVPDADFNILLAYLEGLKGQSRTRTIEEAEKHLQSYESENKSSDSEDGDEETMKITESENDVAQKKNEKTSPKLTEEQYNRVRQILQTLT